MHGVDIQDEPLGHALFVDFGLNAFSGHFLVPTAADLLGYRDIAQADFYRRCIEAGIIP